MSTGAYMSGPHMAGTPSIFKKQSASWLKCRLQRPVDELILILDAKFNPEGIKQSLPVLLTYSLTVGPVPGSGTRSNEATLFTTVIGCCYW